MNTMTLTRESTSDEGTLGILRSEALEMSTGELPWRNNRVGLSCIPPGSYVCTPHVSPRHGKCFWLKDVPGRTEILIHAANYMGSTAAGYRTDLLGCIAVGMGRGEDAKGQDMVLKSRIAMNKLIEYTENKPFMLEIINETGTEMEVV